MMIVVGQFSTLEEKKEIELIAKISLVGNRARMLGSSTIYTQINQEKKSKHQIKPSIDTCEKRVKKLG